MGGSESKYSEEVMIFRLVVTPSESKDAEDAAIWYNKQSNGLGHEFLLSADAAIHFIRRNPFHFAIVTKNYRRAVIPRFHSEYFTQ